MPFRSLLQYWLANVAKTQVRQAVTQAAQKQLASKVAVAETPPKACEIGLVFALGIESGCLEDRLQNSIALRGDRFKVIQGELNRRGVAIILSGPGQNNAVRATHALIDGHKPGIVLSAGFAGGLQASMQRNDILLANRIVNERGGEWGCELSGRLAWPAESATVHKGSLLTADHVVRLPQRKRELGKQYDAAAVDMETCFVAEVCRQRQVPFASVRVINDTFDELLPSDIEHLLMQKTGAAQFGAALGAVWRRPGSAKEIYQLRENALVASERLAKFLAAVIT